MNYNILNNYKQEIDKYDIILLYSGNNDNNIEEWISMLGSRNPLPQFNTGGAAGGGRKKTKRRRKKRRKTIKKRKRKKKKSRKRKNKTNKKH